MRRHTLPSGIWNNPIYFATLGFGAGAVPYAPGTAGTLLAVPAYVLMSSAPPVWYVSIVLMLFAVGVWLCHQTEKALGVHDHPSIVWDEIVGYLVTMFIAPREWMWIVIGFCLFRLFDICKPFPIGLVERRVQGGLGTMLDDVLAGVYAWAALQALAYLFF